MTKYKEFTIYDLGYASPDGYDLAEVWGLDNRDDQKFYHKGYAGLPDQSGAAVHLMPETADKSKVLYCYEGTLEGGTPVDAADVVALLKSAYGWPDETSLDENGIPTRPLQPGEPGYNA